MTEASGSRILVVEDEIIISLLIAEALEQLGYRAVGPFTELSRALVAAETEELYGAVVDFKIVGGQTLPVMNALNDRGIPFILATGLDPLDIPAFLPKSLQLRKPFTIEAVKSAILRLQRAS